MSRTQRTSGPPCLDAQASARTDTGGATATYAPGTTVSDIGAEIGASAPSLGSTLSTKGSMSPTG